MAATRDAENEPSDASIVRFPDAGTDQVVSTLGIQLTECSQRSRVETIGTDLAFDGVHLVAAADHKVYLAARFVAPIVETLSAGWETHCIGVDTSSAGCETSCPHRAPQHIQHEMLPEEISVFITNITPPTDERDKASVEPVDLGAAHELAASVAVKRRQGVKRARLFSASK